MERYIFSVDERYGFVNIDSVSNLTITGLPEQGTLILCSPQSTFGFHIGPNATDITLTGLTIQNCGDSALYTSHSGRCDFKVCLAPNFEWIETLFFIEGSKNITLSNVHIQNSPGNAVTVIDSKEDRSMFMREITMC